MKGLYKAFEDKYRGSREEIINRLKIYRPFILALQNSHEENYALDLGCGRGEWLELLDNLGINSIGIDINAEMLEECNKKGFNTEETDGLNYLKGTPDNTFTCISAFHLIEHINYSDLLTLIQEAKRTLIPGGILILETPNPDNIKVATTNFYLDPSHIKPIPSLLLDMTIKYIGFDKTAILNINEAKNDITKENISLSDVIHSSSQDYSIVAIKNKNTGGTDHISNLFHRKYGKTTNDLSSLYDKSIQERFKELESKHNKLLEQYNITAHMVNRMWGFLRRFKLIVSKPKHALLYLKNKTTKIIIFLHKKYVSYNLQNMSSKRIFIDCSFISSSQLNTGIQRVVRNVINNISNNNKNITVVPVILSSGAFIKVNLEPNHTNIYLGSKYSLLNRIAKPFNETLKYINQFFYIQYLHEGDILLMLDSSWHLDVWESVKHAKEVRNVKVIGVVYDLIPVTHPEFCDENLTKVFKDWYEHSLLHFDGYIAISKTVQNDIIDYINKSGRDSSKYTFDFFNLASELNQNNMSKESIRHNLFKDIDIENSYLIVSTIEPRKNHKYLFDTFKKLWANNIDAKLFIIGKIGWKIDGLISEITSHPMYNNKVFIFNDLNDSELQYCYKNSKALLFPSFVEGYGLPIIESLQNNLPVLASDTPIHREVGGSNIDYFDINDDTSLLTLIMKIEREEKTLLTPTDRIKVNNWKESSMELLEKVINMSKYD